MTAPCIRNGKGTTLLIGIDRNFSDVESDDYSESARSYELGKASDFACARPRPDFSAFLCLWRKVTIGWEMRPVRLVLQNIRNFFFCKTDGASLLIKIVGPVRAAIRRKVQVRKVREKPGGRLFTTFTDVLRPLTSLVGTVMPQDCCEGGGAEKRCHRLNDQSTRCATC